MTLDCIDSVKNSRFLQVKKLVDFLETKGICIDIDGSLFYNSNSYYAYSLIVYSKTIEYIEKFITDRIDIAELENSINCLSEGLDTIDSNLIITKHEDSTIIKSNIYTQSVDVIKSTSFAYMLTYISNISVLNHIKPNDTIHNHSDDFHMNTVTTDFIEGSNLQNSEVLVHESSHIYLNIFLECNSISLDDSRLYLYAPWKPELKRPERGFIHGVFAFSMVICFYKELLRDSINISDDDIRFIESYIKHRKKQLSLVKPNTIEILKKYPKNLEKLIIEVLEKSEEK